MKNHVLVLCTTDRVHAGERLVEAARADGIALDLVRYRDIRFDYNHGFLRIDAGAGSRDLRDYSHYVFRGSAGYHTIKNAVLTAVAGTGRVLNLDAYRLNFGYYNKLVQLARLTEAGLPLIPTRLANDKPQFDAFVAQALAQAPAAMLKPVAGGRGTGIRMVHAPVTDDPGLRPDQTLVQDYMPIEHDYRVLVLGYKVIGAMRRTKPKGSVVSNFSQGGAVSPVVLSDAVCALAVKAARVMRTEFAGVDILMHQLDPYILEVNAMPEFAGFEQATGRDVARAILRRLLTTPNSGDQRQFPEIQSAASGNAGPRGFGSALKEF